MPNRWLNHVKPACFTSVLCLMAKSSQLLISFWWLNSRTPTFFCWTPLLFMIFASVHAKFHVECLPDLFNSIALKVPTNMCALSSNYMGFMVYSHPLESRHNWYIYICIVYYTQLMCICIYYIYNSYIVIYIYNLWKWSDGHPPNG